ncbi:MAG: alternative ribosome rescue aminoacyl-tRNA hydrolase ArfB [Desulfatibacillaceae bacterium]
MIRITPNISIDESEVTMDFVRASGPGGQNVNKVASAVQLRFDAAGSPSLPEDVRQRLMALAGSRLTESGEIVIDARRHRSQERNRQDALDRLAELIQKAAYRPPKRKTTRIPRAAKKRRLEGKRKRGEKKKLRKPVRRDGE